jgi:hypothetical protein
MAEVPMRGVGARWHSIEQAICKPRDPALLAVRTRVTTAAVRLEYDDGSPPPPEDHVVDFNKLIARVKNILLQPKSEWPKIAVEPATPQSLYLGYVAILAAIPAVIAFLHYSVIGVTVPIVGGSYRLGVGAGGSNGRDLRRRGGVSSMMLIIDALAPSFGGEKNQVQALKSIAYAYTASWVASILGIIGSLGMLAMLAAAIYGIYLLYLGLPHTMKCPQDKAGGYAAVVIVLGFVIGMILGLVLATVTGLNAMVGGAMSHGILGSTSDATYTPGKGGALGALAAIGQQAADAGRRWTKQKGGARTRRPRLPERCRANPRRPCSAAATASKRWPRCAQAISFPIRSPARRARHGSVAQCRDRHPGIECEGTIAAGRPRDRTGDHGHRRRQGRHGLGRLCRGRRRQADAVGLREDVSPERPHDPRTVEQQRQR